MTSRIQRWEINVQDISHMGPRDDGDWCKSEDVTKLEALLEQRDAEIERLKKEKILGVQTITELKKRIRAMDLDCAYCANNDNPGQCLECRGFSDYVSDSND